MHEVFREKGIRCGIARSTSAVVISLIGRRTIACISTFRLVHGTLSPAERDIVFSHVRTGDGRFYVLHAVVVMPHHVHVILTPNAAVDLSRITKGMKGVSARLVNESRGTRGTLWQDESFDRIIRWRDEFDEKLEYVYQNPEKNRLVERAQDYAWLLLRE